MKKILATVRRFQSTSSLPLMAGIFDFGSRVQQATPIPGNSGGDQLNNTLNNLWGKILDATFLLLGFLAIIILINAGIRLIASAGNPERIKTARATIVNAVLAIILIIAAYTVIQLIIQVMTYFAGKSS